MMGMLWVVFFVALTGSHFGYGLPIGPTPQTYPYDGNRAAVGSEGWGQGGLYAAVPALALVITAVGLLFGCTWCFKHKDCKPNQGEDNQLFTGNVTHHLHEVRRSNPPDSGFSEPVNNNISEDNNNGPISLREMQNIANNNAAAYIVSENEERNRVSRESVVEFEPLPSGIRVVDPLERYADWFGGEDFSRNRLQYLREIGRGWFGRVVEGEIEERGTTSTVAVKILNQNASLDDKARFLEEARVYRDISHENVLGFISKCLQEDPWILIFEFCPMDLQQYLIVNRHKMASLNESGVPLRLMCDVSSALAHLHSRGHLYGHVWSGSVLVRGAEAGARGVLGRYAAAAPPPALLPPDHTPHALTASSDVWSLGTLIWQVCTWGMMPPHHPPPLPDLPCPYRNHLYQVMQLCWNPNAEARPTCAQVHALLNHLYTTQAADDARLAGDFEERWQRLKPNTIPVVDEHRALVHAIDHAPPASASTASAADDHLPTSDTDFDNTRTIQDTLSVDMDTAVSRSSSIMSDKDPLSVQIKSESLTNLHGSLEDVRNIYLTHNEMAVLECHQGNISLDDSREKEHDRSDSSVDPWLKDIIAGSQDDVSYYKDVSDVIKNLDNILNSEKTSSSESSHQASPSRDNLSLDCKKDYPMQSSMVKSPGISNFQNILESGLIAKSPELEACEEDDVDRDTLGTLSHSFERHSDTLSQQTLENITPETPIKDLDLVCSIEDQNEHSVNEDLDKSDKVSEIEQDTSLPINTELPNEHKIVNSDNKIPKLKELCVASIPSVSETNIEVSNGTQDCLRSCDNNLAEERTDKEIETKSIDDIVKENDDTTVVEKDTEPEAILNLEIQKLDSVLPILPKALPATTSPVLEETSILEKFILAERKAENDDFLINESPETSDNSELNGIEENIVVKDLILPTNTITDPSIESKKNVDDSKNTTENDMTAIEEVISIAHSTTAHSKAPESVQNIVYSKETMNTKYSEEIDSELLAPTLEDPTPMSPESVQTIDNETLFDNEMNPLLEDVIKIEDTTVSTRSEHNNEDAMQSNNSTAYMDLISATNDTVMGTAIDTGMKEVSLIKSCLDMSAPEGACTLVKNESTVYMDLPSMIKETDNFLQSERIVSSQNDQFKDVCSSTPIASDHSTDNTLENSVKVNEVEVPHKDTELKDNQREVLCETKVPLYGPGVTVTKLEQRCVPDSLSPFESPTKSHHTDTYDENSSVVLGPFENCTLELFKGVKSIDAVDLPKEELLAFSSNFSEMNLETPSPLRDGNFLNEVPDIIHDDIQFDDLDTLSEQVDKSGAQTEDSNDTDKSGTEKRVSPLTPPNSPGNFLASTSQQKYSVVDIDLDPPMEPSTSEVDYGLPKAVDLNQIELQITTKMAMAENENNLNIEYSGPLTVEGVVSDETMVLHDSEQAGGVEEAYLGGNGVASLRAALELDEECVKALRDELELKLPLAQVANIEPACGGEWGGSLPPPPELILSYPGALSPIAEETRQQLSAYENDANWNMSTRTDSSESYPEPCNNSTDEVTDLPTGLASARDHDTYTLPSRGRGDGRDGDRDDRDRGHDYDHSPDRTYTLHRDNTSKEVTMSADSLNASPRKKPLNGSPIDDRTYNKNDEEKESRCERISQVSPFILSPTTDSSAPSDLVDNATGVSTLSKTTVPTDAKPSETHCLSKATSIDSWCSNDTLYNVEENFDDLAMDSDLPLDFEAKEPDSESSDTLTHNDDDKELSHCSTYIVHDSKSEACETFSPDSITANDNCTYTKARTDAAATTSVLTKSDLDSTKNTQTKDLAYGTLMSGLPSYSNCTTEVASGFDDVWKMQQPELVRRSPIADEINITPPKFPEEKLAVEDVPQLTAQPRIKKMDSIEISCIHDNLIDSQNKHESPENKNLLVEITDSPNCRYKNMAPSVTSTPLTEVPTGGEGAEVDESIPMPLPEDASTRTPDFPVNNIPNFQTFMQSAEMRPQDISPNADGASNQDTEVLLEGDSKTLSRISNRDSLAATDHTPNYSDFENSAITKPQDVVSRDKSSQSIESGISSDEFRHFESSARGRPQDLSSVIDASSLLLNSERRFSESAVAYSPSLRPDQTSRSESRLNDCEPIKSLDVSPPNDTNLIGSHDVGKIETPKIFYVDLELEEETEQPHSIIMTERDVLKETPNRTYDSHAGLLLDLNHTYDSHGSRYPVESHHNDSHRGDVVYVNGIDKKNNIDCENKSPKTEDLLGLLDTISPTGHADGESVVAEASPSKSDGRVIKEIKCNGNSEKYATVEFLNETFEELIESNVDDGDCKDFKPDDFVEETPSSTETKTSERSEVISPEKEIQESKESPQSLIDLEEIEGEVKTNGILEEDEKLTSVTENFLQNEKKFCQLDCYFPLLNDIRFTGPAAEIMSTSFTQDSPTEPMSPECERDGKPDAADILKEWDSDSDSHSTNSSSGEFIWKDGDGHETPLVPSTHFQHQRGSGGSAGAEGADAAAGDAAGALSDASADSGSGSEGDEVEFVPSSWDCRAAPAKSSLRSLEATPDSKKRVVFKRQKYHCVYEYPREVVAVDASPAAYVPDLSTYSEWDPSSAEEAELGYGQLFGAPSPLDLYPLRAGVAYDYDEDFFISSSARPFESLGVMSSQFFPGMYVKGSLERDLGDDAAEEFPPPPSPLPPPPLPQTRTPSLDFTTPDSGVEDITPGSTAADDDFPEKKPAAVDADSGPCWRPADSGSSSESVSPSSPGGEALGGLRHTRDKLKLDLPPSPHVASPRHARVFSFVLDKPKRRAADDAAPAAAAPLVMTDDTPVAGAPLPLGECEAVPLPEPTFSTFGKPAARGEAEARGGIVLTDEAPEPEPGPPAPTVLEAVKGEGTVLDSGDEDSGIESSSKATLERNKTTPNVS